MISLKMPVYEHLNMSYIGDKSYWPKNSIAGQETFHLAFKRDKYYSLQISSRNLHTHTVTVSLKTTFPCPSRYHQ